MAAASDEFYRINKLPPYVFAVINEMKARARHDNLDVVDLGMGNPDGATPRPVVNKLLEAARNPRNHRYSLSKGIPQLRAAITDRYARNYGVTLDPVNEAIVTIGAKDALAHLMFAIVGPGDIVASPNPAYPIHQYGVIMSEGHAWRTPLRSFSFRSLTTRRQLVSISISSRKSFVWRNITAHGSFTISPMQTFVSMATKRRASLRWKGRKTSR
jgi:alanine-synthesizing transaminase